MVVKVSKPEINVREKISELDKPSGTAGQAMLAAETPQEQFNLIGAGRRNLLINGDFSVSQRGVFTTATTLPTTHTYHVDRWAGYRFSNDTGTFQHKLDQELPDGSYTNTFRISSTSADLDAPFYQHIEDNKAVWGKEFTLSFWYKSTTEYMYNFWNGTTQTHILLPNTNDVWTKYIKTYKFPSNGTNLRVEFYSHTETFSSGTHIEFAQVQLELGKVATPFEHRSYGEELALCQRYYEVLRQNDVFGGDGFNTVTTAVSNGTNIYGPITFKVVKRARPSVGVGSGTKFRAFGSASLLNLSATEFYSPGTEVTRIRVTTNGFSAGEAACLEFDGTNGTNGYIYADAEL